MQPYFFPYLGYFTLLRHTDSWVVFDVVQYNRRSWMNRNRILHPRQGWQYISAPVAHAPHGTLLKDIRLADPAAAQQRLLGQLGHYRRHAPHYRRVVELVEQAFARAAGPGLVDLNIAALTAVCDYLGMAWHGRRCCELGLNLSDVAHPGQWALRIAQALGADAYLNPPGGRELFRPEEWRQAGIRLMFSPLPDLQYACGPHAFEPHLSILDVLMWNTPEAALAALDRQELTVA